MNSQRIVPEFVGQFSIWTVQPNASCVRDDVGSFERNDALVRIALGTVGAACERLRRRIVVSQQPEVRSSGIADGHACDGYVVLRQRKSRSVIAGNGRGKGAACYIQQRITFQGKRINRGIDVEVGTPLRNRHSICVAAIPVIGHNPG